VGVHLDGAAGFADFAGENEFEIVGEVFDAAPLSNVVWLAARGVAEDGFGHFEGEGEFTDALGAGEHPGGGEAVGLHGFLEEGDGAVLALDFEHGEKIQG
jgi:hypothetical protein